jgi:hypothetical protein
MKEERVDVADHMSGATSWTMRNGNVLANGNVNVKSTRLSTAVMGTIQRLLLLLVEATAEAARAMTYTEKKQSVNLVRANGKKTSVTLSTSTVTGEPVYVASAVISLAVKPSRGESARATSGSSDLGRCVGG